jgi:hypothetical protein
VTLKVGVVTAILMDCYVYDVTSLFNVAVISMTISPEADNLYALYGAYLIVFYQDSNSKNKTIWIK